MLESRPDFATLIPQDLMLARLAQLEQMREFFIQMWLQNPALAEHAGQRVQDLLSSAAAPVTTTGERVNCVA
jgi:hypothetical protein